MRRLLLFSVFVLLTIGRIAFAQDAGIQTSWTCPERFAGQTLNVYNWSTYVAENTISNFQTLCDVQVTYDIYESNEFLLARMRQGNPGYDIIVPTGNTLNILINEALLLPLNKDLIPNFANLSPAFQDSPNDPGAVYSVPYQWGTMAIGYDFNKVGQEITSWTQFFSHDGPVAWLEDQRAVMGVALLMLNLPTSSTNASDIAAARDFLIANGANVVTIAGDDGQERLATGEAEMVIEYSGDILQVITACQEDPACTADFRYVIPEEGGLIWTDYLAVPVGAQNPDLAMTFIDYILDPQVGADISNYTAYATPNQAALDGGLIDEAMRVDPAVYPTDDILGTLFYAEAFPMDVQSDAEMIWNNAWDEVKIGLGR